MANNHDNLSNPRVWRTGVKYLSKSDKVLARLMSRMKQEPLRLSRNYYHTLVLSIISQQIAWSAANAIMNKFKGIYNGKIPEPEIFLKTNPRKVRGAGVSPQKYSYIKDLCERINGGKLDLRSISYLSDEEAIRELDEVKGIGRWTAEMFLIFSLGRTDIMPADDLGFRKAVQRTYKLRSLPDRKTLERVSRSWRPYRSIATLYLWRSSD